MFDPDFRNIIKLEDVIEKGWKNFDIKRNIKTLRQITTVFCYDFNIIEPLVYVVDVLDDGIDAIYYPLSGGSDKQPKILLAEKLSDIMTYFHEITHHLQDMVYYPKYGYTDIHGYTFQLAKRRVATWATKNVLKVYPCALNNYT